MFVFFETKDFSHDVGQIAIRGNIGKVDYSILLPAATDVVLRVSMLGLRA